MIFEMNLGFDFWDEFDWDFNFNFKIFHVILMETSSAQRNDADDPVIRILKALMMKERSDGENLGHQILNI